MWRSSRGQTPEGIPVVLPAVVYAKVLEEHASRCASIARRVTHLTAINARWLLVRDGELVATLADRRQLRLGRQDIADLIA